MRRAPASRASTRRRGDGSRTFQLLSGKSWRAQLVGELVQLVDELRCKRNAVAGVRDALGVALLAGQPDAVDVGKTRRVAQRADQRVDLALELRHVAESLDRDGDDRLPGVRRRGIVLVEI